MGMRMGMRSEHPPPPHCLLLTAIRSLLCYNSQKFRFIACITNTNNFSETDLRHYVTIFV